MHVYFEVTSLMWEVKYFGRMPMSSGWIVVQKTKIVRGQKVNVYCL